MTINGGQPHRVGYEGQTYRIVVDEETDGEVRKRRIGWSNAQHPGSLHGLNLRPGWSNARYETVEDQGKELENVEEG